VLSPPVIRNHILGAAYLNSIPFFYAQVVIPLSWNTLDVLIFVIINFFN